MLESSKLSNRFKKQPVVKIEEPVIENSDLTDGLLEKVNSVPYWNEYSPEKQRDMVKNFVKNTDVEDKEPVSESLIPYVTGFGPLQNLLDNDKVNAVFVNGTNSVHIEIGGRVFDTEIKLSQNMLQYVLNLTGNSEDSVYSCRINNYIIDVIKPEICVSGVNIIIRKIRDFDIDALIENGTLTKELFEFLTQQIDNKKRIVISGPVNSGKTTLLDVLLKSCLAEKRCYLFENSTQISAQSNKFVKFDISKYDYETIMSFARKAFPEYIISDLNKVDDIAEISTLRASSLESSFRTLISKYSDMTEKFAKLKVLNDFDYIVYMDNFKVISVAELKPAKTMALSVNVIFEA